MFIVTSYSSPDLDGVACSVAYTELLNKTGFTAIALYFGNLGLEVDFVKNYAKDFPIEKCGPKHNLESDLVLVDTSDPDAIDPAIDPDRVKEIFDHRRMVFVDKFVNAQVHIELVGSCATLITEEFKRKNLVPVKSTAIYLYSAIVSNTINFKNSVTTQRDIEAANWLKDIIKLDDTYTKMMFGAKSNITNKNLYSILSQDFAIKTLNGKKIGIAQIEMVGADRMGKDLYKSLQQALKCLKNENKLDYLLFSGIDVLEGFNIFYTIDEESRKLFFGALGISGFSVGDRTNFIVMRKEIWPKIETMLKSSSLVKIR